MTNVKMKVAIASPDWSYVPEQEAYIDDDLARAWSECGHCEIIGEPIVDPAETPEDVALEGTIISLGGSWYELPGGLRVQGKEKALKALKGFPVAEAALAMEGGENNAIENDNSTSSGTSEPGGGEATPPG